MTLEEARNLVRGNDAKWERLVEAAGILCGAQEASFEDLIECLKHRGLPQEFAAMALYKRTKRPRRDESIQSIIMDPKDWSDYLEKAKLK